MKKILATLLLAYLPALAAAQNGDSYYIDSLWVMKSDASTSYTVDYPFVDTIVRAIDDGTTVSIDLGQFGFDNTVMSTTTNTANMILRPYTGKLVYIDEDLSVADTLAVGGTSTLNGDVEVNAATNLYGDVELGNTTADSITFNGQMASDVVPETDSAYDLGSTTLRWAEIWGDLLTVDNVKLDASRVSSSGDLELQMDDDADGTNYTLFKNGAGTTLWTMDEAGNLSQQNGGLSPITLNVGGGYGSTGATISSAGALSMDGSLIVGPSGVSGLRFVGGDVGGTEYIQAGADASDTGAKITISRKLSVSNLDEFIVLADDTRFSGNVGIGPDTTPDYLLDVQGTLNADGNVTLGDAVSDDVTVAGNLIANTLDVASSISVDADAVQTSSILDVSAGIKISSPTVPATASDTGTTGMISWDSNYIYVCVATDTWKRVAISTW